MNAMSLFTSTMNFYLDDSICEETLVEAEKHYCVKPYKIKKITGKEAKQIFSNLLKKYETGEIDPLPIDWHKNQRKIFIWFLICFCNLNNTFPDAMEQQKWNMLSFIFLHKDPLFLQYQGLNIMKNQRKMIWTQEDDEILVKLVKQLGVGNWNQISKYIFFQQRKKRFITPKQCRQRWHNHKNQDISRSEWTLEEDFQILKYCYENSKKWCKIVKLLNNTRTQHMIKNRFYCLLNKIYKKKSKNQKEVLEEALMNLQQKIKSEKLTIQQNKKEQNFFGKPIMNSFQESQKNERAQSSFFFTPLDRQYSFHNAQQKMEEKLSFDENNQFPKNPLNNLFMIPNLQYLPLLSLDPQNQSQNTPQMGLFQKSKNQKDTLLSKGFTYYQNPSLNSFPTSYQILTGRKEILEKSTTTLSSDLQLNISHPVTKQIITLQNNEQVRFSPHQE